MKFDKEFLDLLNCYNDEEGVKKLKRLKIKYNEIFDSSVVILAQLTHSNLDFNKKTKLKNNVIRVQSNINSRLYKMDRVITSYEDKQGLDPPF